MQGSVRQVNDQVKKGVRIYNDSVAVGMQSQ